MTNIDFSNCEPIVERPLLFLILVPALVLGIIPFLRLQKKRRTSTKHLIPFIVHLTLIFLLSALLAGVTLRETSEEKFRTKIVFLADVSDSNISNKDDMNDYIRSVIKSADSNVEFSVIMFANSVIETVDSDEFEKNSLDYLKFTKDPGVRTDATDIEEAIAEATKLFGDPDTSEYIACNKKIIILSDGLETVGNGLNAAKQIDEGIQVTGAHFNMVQGEKRKSEMQLVSINTTGKVGKGKDVTVELVVNSTKFVGNVNFTIYDGDRKEVFKRDVEEGVNVFKYSYTPEVAGVNTIRAAIELDSKKADKDVIEGNNTLYAWYTLEAQKTVLIVDGDKEPGVSNSGGQFNQIAASDVINRWGDYGVYGPVSPQDFPTSLEEMLKYDQIVLMDVDFGDLPTNAGENLKRYVEEVGRGLFVSFGDNFYDIEAGEYVNTPIAEILPVELQLGEERETVGMVLVVDISSSMREILSDNKSRFDVVVESIRQVLMLGTEAEDIENGRGFNDNDFLGVVCFDQDSHVVLPMQQLGNKENRIDVCDIIEYNIKHEYFYYYLKPDGTESDIPYRRGDPSTKTQVEEDEYGQSVSVTYRAPTGVNTSVYDKSTEQYIKSYGTSYKWAIQEASNMLSAQNNIQPLNIKQVLLMSDGAPNDIGSGYEGIVERMAKAGIATSSISIGAANKDSDQYKELEKIADIGGGTIFIANNADALTTEIVTKAEEITPDLINEKDVMPFQISLNSSVIKGVYDYEIIKGYYASKIKSEADLVLCVEQFLQRPLYAEWGYGLGKVGVFMSDLGRPEWTSTMFTEDHGVQLIANMFNATMNRQVGSTGIDCLATRNESTTNIVATVPKPLRDSELLVAFIRDKDGNDVNEVTLKNITETKYRGTLPTTEIDETYIIEIAVVDQNLKSNSKKDTTTLAVTGYYNEEFDVFATGGKDNLRGYVSDGTGKLLEAEGFKKFFEGVDIKEIVVYHDVMFPITIIALILFIVDIIFRNIVVKRKKDKTLKMTDEERLESMRGR